jgi:hypothetical protein
LAGLSATAASVALASNAEASRAVSSSGHISIVVSPNPATAGSRLVIAGRAGTSSKPGVAVTLWEAPYGQSQFRPAMLVFTRSGGAYRMVRRVGTGWTNRRWFVTAGGQRSRIVLVRVRPLITLHASPSTLAAGQAATLTGRVRPAHPGEHVELQQRFGRKWRTVGRLTVNRHSSFETKHHFGARGIFQLRVTFTGNGKNAAGRSAPLRLTVGRVAGPPTGMVGGPSSGSRFPDVRYCAATSGTCSGAIKFNCAVNTPLGGEAFDPIADWGEDPSMHSHDEMGAKSFGASTTLALQLAGETSCDVPSNHDMVYWPTVYNADGTPATIAKVGYYMGTHQYIDPTRLSGGTTGGNLTPINGLRFKEGTSECTSLSCARKVFFCDGPSNDESKGFDHIPSYAECAATGHVGGGYTITFGTGIPGGGDCWDPSGGYGEGFGASSPPPRLVYSDQQPGGVCPDGYLAIPTPGLKIHVNSGAGEGYGYGGYLASDNDGMDPAMCQMGIPPDTTDDCGASAHFDFAYGFLPGSLGTRKGHDDSFTDMINQCWDVVNQNPHSTSITCNITGQGVLVPNVAGNRTNFAEPITN